MVSGQILLSGIMLSLYKEEERPMSVFCFVFPIALHCYTHSQSAVAGNFLTSKSTSGSVLSRIVENKFVFGQEGL